MNHLPPRPPRPSRAAVPPLHLPGPARTAGSFYDSSVDQPGLADLRALEAALQRARDTADARERAMFTALAALRSGVGGGRNSLLRDAKSKQLSADIPDNINHIQARNVDPNGQSKRAATPLSQSFIAASAPGINTANPSRTVKRSRFDSESSLSPASSSTSSFDLAPISQKQASGSRASSPASTVGISSALNGTSIKPLSKEGKGKAPEAPGTVAFLPAIPGLSGPVPTLPGFTKKKKAKQLSPSTASLPASPVLQQQNDVPFARLPPLPSSLPPPPASLPPKPGTVAVPPQAFRRDGSARPASSISASHSVVPRASSLRLEEIEPIVSTAKGERRITRRSMSPMSAKPLSSVSAPSPLSASQQYAPPPPLAPEPPQLAISPPPDEPKDAQPVINGTDAGHEDGVADIVTTSLSAHSSLPKRPASASPAPPSVSITQPIARKTLPPANRAPVPIQPTISRPGTPQARKTIPPSAPAEELSEKDSHTPAEVQTALSSQQPGDSLFSTVQNGPTIPSPVAASSPPRSQSDRSSSMVPNTVAPPNPALSAIQVESKEARLKRKEEKRKRRMIAAAGLALATSSSPLEASVGMSLGKHQLNGRSDSLPPPPNKTRRLQSSPGAESGGGGLKVKLNGYTLNRTKSTTPSGESQNPSFAQPAPPSTRKIISVPGVADDFSLSTRSLVPPVPPIQLPVPTPQRQIDVCEDFDHVKPASQVPYSTFAHWVNDYLRPFGEDDLAFLSSKPEDPSFFEVPSLGPHYLDTWAAMDAELNGDQAATPPVSTSLVPPPLKRFKNDNLTNETLSTENVHLGPLAERLISAFRNTDKIPGIFQELAQQQEAAVLNGPEGAEALSSGDGTLVSPTLLTPVIFDEPDATTPSIRDMDALEFESRLSRELAFLGVIPPLPARAAVPIKRGSNDSGAVSSSSSSTLAEPASSVDWGGREDDEISASLRACQRLLRQQMNINEFRKSRLAERVRSRIAYQEYETLRDGLEAVIEGAWNKRQRAAQRKAQKDKKDKDKNSRDKDREKEASANLAQSIAALNQPQALSGSLIAALTKRRNLVDAFAHLFPEGGLQLPQESIYDNPDVDVG